jgi:ABC toxin N-terminal region/Neuraminidase-like domain/Putative peptidoglycan binding domain
MNLQGRDLQQGLSGSDVAELQAQLSTLSYTVPSSEQQATSFGAGTFAAVKQFQTDQGLPATGVIDSTTAAALTTVIVGNTYVVSGAVSSSVSASVVGLTVLLVDKSVGGDVSLATTSTGPGGAYSISTVISSVSLKQRNKFRPDLQVRVSSGKTFLAASTVAYNAALNVMLNVLLPTNATALVSEYEALTASIGTLYTGQLGALQEGSDRQDITFLANKSGWDARAVALAALADQFSQLTAPPLPAAPSAPSAPTGVVAVVQAVAPAAGATVAAPLVGTPVPSAPAPGTPPPAPAPVPANVSLQPEFYYALFRAGLPADSNSLFRTSSQTVQAIWQQAITQGVIPQSLASQVPNAVQAYQAVASVNLLTAAPAIGVSTLGAMLTVSKLTAAEQATFAQLSAQYGSDPTTFWAQVSSSFGAAVTKQLQLDGQMFYLTLNNAPLVTALYSAESGLVSSLDLVTRGYYDASNWMPLIGSTSIPTQIAGQSAANYADFLAAQIRLSFPTAVAGDQVKRGIFPITDLPAVATSVSQFLTSNYSQFFIGAEPVEAFLIRNKITVSDNRVVPQIKRLQRVYQLTADDQSMSVLLRHNLDSAYAITRYNAAGFQSAFQTQLGGADNAAATYARAQHIYSSVTNIALGYLSAKQSPTLGGTSPILSGFPTTPSSQPYPVVAYPTLESLFGSLDYCTCEDCHAILSPAAYLVDLLNYMDQPSPSAGFSNPQSVLLQRRPDLQYLPLTCENTNTPLPYIDIVNETLEYFVANQLSLTNFQGYSTDDTVTSPELIAGPQFTDNAAYTVLQGAFFPPPLPFNRPLAQLRQLFQNMGVTLPAVMAALRTSSSTVINPTGTTYGEADVCLEYLGISRDEYRIFTDGTLQLPGLYGYSGSQATVLAQLQTITMQDFSRRTGVAYSDIVSILKTQFINPDAILIERLQRLSVPFSTLQTLMSTPSTAAAFMNSLPSGLDARAYGGSYPTDYSAVVAWVTNAANFTNISNIITLSNPANNPDECAGSSFEFRYLNGNPLTATDFEKLIRFIRLWRKLGLTIEQTDDLLSALYPAVDLPSGSNDTVNLPLLDAGFKIALTRIGVLFQVMNLLSLNASQALDPLLACWAPIGTVGDNALYGQMFGGPTLQQEDPGAPIATVGGTPNAGDTLVTTINNVQVSQTVNSGETSATIATNIASTINGTTAIDPTTALALNQRISASSEGPVVTIRAGFTLTYGPVGAFTQNTATPLSQSLTLAEAVAPGSAVTVVINTVTISYTMMATDTPVSVAVNIANAINNTDSPDPYSGLPLNSLIVAANLGPATTISSINSGAPLSLSCSITEGTTGASYTVGTQTSAFQTATVGGTVASGDVLTTTINGLNIPFTVAGQATPAAVAAAIATTINGTAADDPVSGVPINTILSATGSGGAVTIAANDPATTFTLSCSATGAMSYAAAGPFATSQTATVASNFAAGAVLTTTINGVSMTYTVVTGDTPASIAGKIASTINATTSVDPTTNVALNQLVSAAAAGAVITVSAIQVNGSFTLAVSVQPGTYTAGLQPAPFADNGYGEFLADLSQTIFGHEPVLRAAFNLTGAEFTLIANTLQFTFSTPLTLENISSLFRVGWLARALGLSVVEFLLLRQMTGLDPFAPLDLSQTPPVEPPVLRFIRVVQALSNAGLAPVQALYLLWNQDISGKSTPDVSVITGLAVALRAAFAAVAAQFTIQSDPDGTIAQSLMALVYGNTATDFYFGLLNNTLVTQIDYPSSTYPAPRPTPLQAVLDASDGRLSYDDLRKQLNFAGVLDAGTQAAIQSAITTYQNVPALLAALGDLALANQQMVGPFFATYPELRPLYTAFESSTAPVQQKRSALLANFLPALIQKRNQEQALATVTAASGNDPSFANELLEDPTILHAATDGTAPIVIDLTALNRPGLAGQIFLANSLAGPPDILLDADPVNYSPSTISAQQTATVSGSITTSDVLTTVINGVSIGYTVPAANHTAADVAAGIAAAITATTTPDPFSGLPMNDVVRATASEGVVTVQTVNSGAGIPMSSSVTTAAAPPTYAAGAQVPASQTATVAGAITVGDILTTTVNTIAVPYTVVASDTSLAILAAHLASAINAIATADPASGLPLNQVITATSSAGVVTVTRSSFGPDLTLGCAVSGGASETYTAVPQRNASQTATLSGLLPANDVVITTINSVATQYIVAMGDTTLAALMANVAAAINANATVDSVTSKALNAIVQASSAAGVLTIATIPPGVPFRLSCSLSLGAYTVSSQVAFLQTAVVAGGITAGDVLSTSINGTTVVYTVTGGEPSVSALAADVAAAINATVALNGVVAVSSVGGILIFREAGSTRFTLACSVSATASATYTAGPQFPAWQAIISGGFSTGDVLTTNVNDGAFAYTIGAADTTPSAIASDIASKINASTTTDPITGLRINELVFAISAGATILFRPAGPAVVMSCSVSAGATEYYVIGGELPAKPGGGPIAGIWSGYLDAPQDGFYNIEIDTDPGATVTLSIDKTPVILTPSANSSVWSSVSPISLTAGELVPIEVTATSIQSALDLNWQSAGLGWQTIPAADLYSDILVDRLQTMYVRYLKATALATELSLTADEIAFLGTDPNYAVNTTDSTDNFTPGTVTFTPSLMTNIAVGSVLVIDTGSLQETVTVTAVTATTFTAVTVNPHNGTVTAFPIVDAPNASTGQGWLNLLSVAPIAGSVTAGLQQVASYASGPQTLASRTATVGGSVTAGGVLITTVNGLIINYAVVAGDTIASIATNIAKGINASTDLDPLSNMPLNQIVSATASGAVITISAIVFGPDFILSCSVSAGASETYVTGVAVAASQSAKVFGAFPPNDVLVTSFNSIAVQYTVTAADTTPAILASHIAAAINATTTLDVVSNLPLNSLIKASTVGGVITIVTVSPGGALAISCSVASLRDVLRDVLNFARMKAAISPNDEQLLDIMEDPGVLSADGVTPQIIKLTGWSLSSLDSLLQQFCGDTQLTSLASIENLRKVFDAFTIVTSCRISAAALLAATTNAPTPATVASLQSALRALYAPSDWLNVIQPVNDALRIQQRDALVAYILQQIGDQYAGAMVTLETTADAPSGSTTLTFGTVAGLQVGMGVEGANVPTNATVGAIAGNTVTLSAAVSADVPPGSSIVFVVFTLKTTADAPAGSSTLTFASLAGTQVNMGVQAANVPSNALVSAIGGNTVTLSVPVSADVPSGSLVEFVPSPLFNMKTADDLLAYFLLDVETQPAVRTSRIRLALSSAQLFIERCLRNLESQVQPTDIDGSLWTWMSRYRVWQANREVFLWPENWLYPELRDDQSPIFKQMMAALLQSDITDDTAASAYLDYLSNLELVAKLEPCGLYYIPAGDDTDETSYVVGRTAGAHRKYYFRELQYGSWTPWTEIQIDCEDMPITPIVWNGRLLLFWLKVTKTSTPQFAQSSPSLTNTSVTSLTLDDLSSYGQTAAKQQTQNNVTVSAILCWSEYYNGKWQPQKSSDVSRPTKIDAFNTGDFDPDRNLLQITPVNVAQQYEGWFLRERAEVDNTLPSDALILGICQTMSSAPLPTYRGGYVLYNTHSLPIRWEDISLRATYHLFENYQVSIELPGLALPATPGRTFYPIEKYTGGTPSGPDTFGVTYWNLTNPGLAILIPPPAYSTAFQNNLLGLNRVARTVDAVSSGPGWYAPFFFEDRRNVFYVTSAQSRGTIINLPTYGFGATQTNYSMSPIIAGLASAAVPVVAQGNPFGPPIPIGGGDPATQIGNYLQQGGNVRAAINSTAPVSYQGVSLFPSGQFVNVTAPLPPSTAAKTTAPVVAATDDKERSK